jgi:serine/threonine-protein kinase
VKVLARRFSSDPEMVSRFVSEARVVNTIRHANIIDVFSFGKLEDGRRYFVMELLSGVALDAYLRQTGPLEPAQVLAIMRGVAKALDAAHATGVIHRDLKPENIFLSFDDEDRPVPKLLDFGIAKLRGDAAVTGHKTRTGTPIGTPHYMSPEQCLGAEVDDRTDVYSFGVVCFEALTGAPPFDASSYLALMTKHTSEERPAASQRRPELGEAFDDALRTIMAREPAERPGTVLGAFELLVRASGDSAVDNDRSPRLPRPQVRPEAELELGTAKTAMDASADAGPSMPSSMRVPLVVAAVLVTGVALYAAAGALGKAEMDRSTDLGSSAALAPYETPAAEATAAPTASDTAASAAASASAEPQATRFQVRLRSNAKSAVAFVGDVELGRLPGPFELEGERGDKRTLTVKAPGYRDARVEVELEPDSDGDVTLIPIPQKNLNRDLEDPNL